MVECALLSQLAPSETSLGGGCAVQSAQRKDGRAQLTMRLPGPVVFPRPGGHSPSVECRARSHDVAQSRQLGGLPCGLRRCGQWSDV